MGFFDFITGRKSEEKKTEEEKVVAYQKPTVTAPTSTIDIFKPKSFDDVAKIIDNLLDGRPAIVHLSDVKDSTAQRVVDLLSGAIYAINGNLCELQKDVYIFTPSGVKIN
ncbi:MAG: cell division protein SepF [Clostridia bacterium]|nr:cell division protein SepF [Clostridia bacterium]